MNAVAAFVLFVGLKEREREVDGKGKKIECFWGIAKIREISVYYLHSR